LRGRGEKNYYYRKVVRLLKRTEFQGSFYGTSDVSIPRGREGGEKGRRQSIVKNPCQLLVRLIEGKRFTFRRKWGKGRKSIGGKVHKGDLRTSLSVREADLFAVKVFFYGKGKVKLEKGKKGKILNQKDGRAPRLSALDESFPGSEFFVLGTLSRKGGKGAGNQKENPIVAKQPRKRLHPNWRGAERV